MDRAQEDGDVATLEAFSLPSCNCRSVADFIIRNRARGRIEGSTATVFSVTVQNIGPEMASVVADLAASDGRVVDTQGGTVVTIDNGDRGLVVHALFRTSEGWKIGQVLE